VGVVRDSKIFIFQGSDIYGASRGRLCDSKAFLLSVHVGVLVSGELQFPPPPSMVMDIGL